MCEPDNRSGSDRHPPDLRDRIVEVVARLEFVKTDVRSEYGRGNVVLRRYVASVGRIARIIAAAVARLALCYRLKKRVFDLTVLTSITDICEGESGGADARIGPEKIIHQQTLEIHQAHILELESGKDQASILDAESPARFGSKRKPIERRAAGRVTEFVDRIAVRVKPLNDTERALIER